jgi:hypothetical protein
VRYVSLYPLTKLLNCRPEFRNTIAAHLLTILLVLMPGLSLDSFELVNCWAVQTLLEEWIASRATEGAEGEKLLEVNYKQFPKTFTSNLKGHNGACWKRHMELMPDFAFIIFLSNVYRTISQLIATFCLFIPYFR